MSVSYSSPVRLVLEFPFKKRELRHGGVMYLPSRWTMEPELQPMHVTQNLRWNHYDVSFNAAQGPCPGGPIAV